MVQVADAMASSSVQSLGDKVCFEATDSAGRRCFVTGRFVAESKRGPVIIVPAGFGSGSPVEIEGVATLVTLVGSERLRELSSLTGWRGIIYQFADSWAPILTTLAESYVDKEAQDLFFSGDEDPTDIRLKALETAVAALKQEMTAGISRLESLVMRLAESRSVSRAPTAASPVPPVIEEVAAPTQRAGGRPSSRGPPPSASSASSEWGWYLSWTVQTRAPPA